MCIYFIYNFIYRGESHWVDGSYPGNKANLDRTVQIIDQISSSIKQWIDQGVFRYWTCSRCPIFLP